MTWGMFKRLVEAQGVCDDTVFQALDSNTVRTKFAESMDGARVPLKEGTAITFNGTIRS